MQKVPSHINIFSKRGFSLVEILVAVSVFLTFVLVLGDISFSSRRQIINAGNRTKAIALANEALEATRNLRDLEIGFAYLPSGTYGLSTTTNIWSFSGSSDVTDIFTRNIVVTTTNDTQKQVDVNVSWADQLSASNSISLSTYLTDWKKLTTCINQANYLGISTTTSVISNSSRRLSGITMSNTATDCSIVIDKVTVTISGSRRETQSILFGGTSVWSGNVNSGGIIDISDYTLAQGLSGVDSEYNFSGGVNNRTFTIMYTMSDLTTKTITNISP